MKKFYTVAIVAVLLSLLGGGTALAQETGPGDSSRPRALAGYLSDLGWQVYDAVAEALNLTPRELFERLHGGETLREIAKAQGVEMATILEAAREARNQATKAAIEEAVVAGDLTREQADKLLERLEAGKPLRRFGPFAGRWHRLPPLLQDVPFLR